MSSKNYFVLESTSGNYVSQGNEKIDTSPRARRMRTVKPLIGVLSKINSSGELSMASPRSIVEL